MPNFSYKSIYKNRLFRTIILIVLLVIPLWAAIFFFLSPTLGVYEANLLSTKVELQFVYYRYQDKDAIIRGFVKEIERLNKIFSSYDKDSELSFVNKRAYYKDVKLSLELLFVIKQAIYYAKLSRGAFDISILPLIRLWKASHQNLTTSPSKQELRRALLLVNYKNIVLKGKSIRFLKKGMAISLGGIAKGYIIDKSIEYLKSKGIQNSLLNIGGDVYAMGSTIHDTKWQIGIRNPRRGKYKKPYIGKVILYNKALATSGDYRRYRVTKQGKRINHIINPRTGYPSFGVVSVSIIARSSLISDAIATIAFVLGPNRAFAFISSLDDVEALIVFEKSLLSKLPSLPRALSYFNEDRELAFLVTKNFNLKSLP